MLTARLIFLMPKKAIVPAASQAIESAEVAASEAQLYARLREILDEGRSRVARSVNSEMVRAYWKIGEAIVEQEQCGKRARRLRNAIAGKFGRALQSRQIERIWQEQFVLYAPVFIRHSQFSTQCVEN